MIKARAPNQTAEEIASLTLVKRVEEVFELTDKNGNVHRVTEIKRLDGNGNQIERIVIDRFNFRDERGKKISARIISIYDANDRLTQVGETYKQKAKSGTLVTKRTTVFDPTTGEVISQKNKTKFEKSGFFNSTAGKILGIALVVGLAIIAPYIATALLSTTVGALGLGTLAISAGIGAAIGQFGVSLAQGASFKDALIAGAITFAATAAAVYLGPQIGALLGNIPGIGAGLTAIKTGLSAIGSKIGSFFGATTGGAAAATVAERLTVGTFFQQFIPQFSLRAGSEVISQTFGKSLGVFGTVATLAVLGTFANAAIGGITNNPINTATFGNNFADSLFSGALQGGIAEALKGENGLGADFLRQFGSNFAGSLKLSGIAAAYSTKQALGIARTLAEQEGITIDQIKDVAVFKDSKVGVLYQKDDVTKYALLGYEKDKFYVLANQEITRSLETLGSTPRTNIVGVDGAYGSKQVKATVFNQNTTIEPTAIYPRDIDFGDPAWRVGDSGVKIITTYLQDFIGELNKGFYDQAQSLGVTLAGYNSPLSYKLNSYTVDGVLSVDPYIYDNLQASVKTVQAASPTFYFSPGRPLELANALEQTFRQQDLNVVVAFSYGVPTTVGAANILQQRGVSIDYLVLIDPANRGDITIPSNVKNVRLFYQNEGRTLSSLFLKGPDSIRFSSSTNFLEPIKVNTIHTLIDDDRSFVIRNTTSSDLSNLSEQRYQLQYQQQL
ncbi:MAG: hypothetical protein HY602_02685, partial [Parcubacteria group bacterium]|nr:hypothetical protein [Parcubacteria group bacterium]